MKIFAKTACLLRKNRVIVVLDNADTMLVWSLTLQTRCQQSRKLCGHGNDYADTAMTTRTLLDNLDGFSQILKGHSSEKKFLGVFTYPIALIKKI